MTVPMPRSILVATDLTPACDAAVATAGRLAARTGAAALSAWASLIVR